MFKSLSGQQVSPIKMKNRPWIWMMSWAEKLHNILEKMNNSLIVDLSASSYINVVEHLKLGGYQSCILSPVNINSILLDNMNVVTTDLTTDEKLLLLDYIVTGAGDINNLPLLPLRSGDCVTLSTGSKARYFFTNNPELYASIPSRYDSLVNPNVEPSLIAKLSSYGVGLLNNNLPAVVKEAYFGNKECQQFTMAESCGPSADNLKNLWNYLSKQPLQGLSSYAGLCIVPSVPLAQLAHSRHVTLFPLSQFNKLLYTIKAEEAGIVRLLRKLGVTNVVTFDPLVEISGNLQSFVQRLDCITVVQKLYQLVTNTDIIAGYEEDIVRMIYGQSFNDTGVQFLKKLKLLWDHNHAYGI